MLYTKNQITCLNKILIRARMFTCKLLLNPSPSKSHPHWDAQQPHPDTPPYRHLVEALQYLTNTCPNIAFIVNKLCQHLNNPLNEHFILLKWLLQYLQAIVHKALFIQPNELILDTYLDSNWPRDITYRWSTSGYYVVINRNNVS